MPKRISQPNPTLPQSTVEAWPTFEQVLYRLHAEGIWLSPQQLATFYLYHGLPVDLCYVPPHLQALATRINDNYQGDMARLETVQAGPWYSVWLEER